MEVESIILNNNQTSQNNSTPPKLIMIPLKVESNIH